MLSINHVKKLAGLRRMDLGFTVLAWTLRHYVIFDLRILRCQRIERMQKAFECIILDCGCLQSDGKRRKALTSKETMSQGQKCARSKREKPKRRKGERREVKSGHYVNEQRTGGK
jgi:hypothetical protein